MIPSFTDAVMDRDRSLKLIDTVLHHFSLEQLVDVVLPEFKILSWTSVRRKIIQEQFPLNKDSVIRVMVLAVKKHKARDETYVTEILQIIRLLDIVIHHHRFKWTAFAMSGLSRQRTRKRYYTSSDIQDSIESIFSQKRRIVHVAVIVQDEICWISLIERTHANGKGIVYKAPIFVAHFPGQPYFFISHSGKKEDILDIISRALGYHDAEDCSLSGKNVRHLFRFLKNLESDASSVQDVLQGVKEYRPVVIEETPRGIDFTQHKSRSEFADFCFGSEPTLQQINVKCSPCHWTVGDIVPDVEGKIFGSMEVSFQSPDILEMLKEMTVKGIFPTPPPTYIRYIQKRGKNDIKLESRWTTSED